MTRPHTEGSTPDPRDITERLTPEERVYADHVRFPDDLPAVIRGTSTCGAVHHGTIRTLLSTIAHLRGEVERLVEVARLQGEIRYQDLDERADRAEAEVARVRNVAEGIIEAMEGRSTNPQAAELARSLRALLSPSASKEPTCERCGGSGEAAIPPEASDDKTRQRRSCVRVEES